MSEKKLKLSTQKFRAIIGKVDDESTWRELVVQSINADRIAAENELARRKLSPIDHTMLMTTAVVFCALKRTGQITAGTFADFEAGCLDFDVLEDEPVDPTPSEPSPE